VEHRKGIEFEKVPSSKKTHAMEAFLPKGVKRPVPAVIMIRHCEENAPTGKWQEHAAWLASHGYAVFDTTCGTAGKRQSAWRTASMAVRFVRENSDKFGTDRDRIGLWGCGGGARIAVTAALRDEEFPADETQQAEDKSVQEDSVSSRVQAVVVTAKKNPIKPALKKHVSFDDPAVLLLVAAGEQPSGRIAEPEAFRKAHVEYIAYQFSGESPCQALDATLTIDGEETPVWQQLLRFADEHLKQAPLNLAVELERVILARVRAQDRVLGTRSITDLRAVLQLAAQRLGREPTPEEMKVARDHAREFADQLVRISAPANGAVRITRVVLAKAISRLSPHWPFTSVKTPATVPAVPAGNLPAETDRD
jgi:hypothetical protein